jgi:hypothetical protein
MPNPSGIPDDLAEAMKKFVPADVGGIRVHYNAARQVHLGALAHTQGTDIFLAPGQERQLPHEVWHAIQQKQGRVSETGRTHFGLSQDAGTSKMDADLAAKRTPL